MNYATYIDISEVNNRKFKQAIPQNLIALDIGGSLAKLVYKRVYRFRRSIPKQSTTNENDFTLPFGFYDYTEHEYEGQKLCFLKFETRYIEDCLDFVVKEVINEIDSEKYPLKVKVTGGGAYRYRDLISLKLGVELDKEDEIECLIRGCIFMLQNIPEELFYYDKHATPAHVYVSSCLTNMFPFLLVNIGSGVSVIKVESPISYQRVGGSSIGGGTFWGLGTLLSGGKYSFDELLQMADLGDHRHVDMLVRDIYGGAYEMLGLPGDLIASSFGLAARHPQQLREVADMVKSLLITVSNNIGQLACLYAKQYNLTRILFGGFFIRGHGLTMEVITYAVRFWSKEAYRALFLRHEGYLGAVGAFLKAVENYDDAEPKTLWAENYVGSSIRPVLDNNTESGTSNLFENANRKINDCVSSSFENTCNQIANDLSQALDLSPDSAKLSNDTTKFNSQYKLERRYSKIDRFELDRVFINSLELFPLVESKNYIPDTWNLTQDEEARAYWLDCLEQGLESNRASAEESQIHLLPDAKERSYQFADRYIKYLHELKLDPSGRGTLSIRCLLSAQQHFLREFGFGDPFSLQKKRQNRLALSVFPVRLKELNEVPSSERQLALFMGFLAGNVFYWDSTESVQLTNQVSLDKFGVSEFSNTLKNLQKRPWLIDDYDCWVEHFHSLKNGPYHCVLIFCNNSGADIILGVLPLVLEFLKQGSKVILAANSSPALNNVTYEELELLVHMAAGIEPSFGDSLTSKHLMLVENGQTTPCLDFRLIASSLVQLSKSEQVDLIIIEGMGRAIHCNLNAKFLVDTLKLAVVKNKWLAQQLGGNLYDVIFKFEQIHKKNQIE